MKVRLLVSRSCAVDGAASAGDVIAVDSETAKRMLEAGQCEPVAEKRAAKAEKRPAAKSGESR